MNTRIFDFTDYKIFIQTWVENRPKKGRGEFLKMSKAMNIQSSQVSQVFKGTRDLNLEQADALADYLQLSIPEKRYLLDLINFARAGTKKLKSFYLVSLREQKADADKLRNRLKVKRALSDAEKSIFYADAIYSHVHLLTHIPGMNSVEKIAEKIKRDVNQVKQIVDFLITAQLIRMTSKGLAPGTGSTHVDAHSPHVLMHHRNWRLKAMQNQTRQNSQDLFYTGQMTMSRADFERCKEILRKTLEEFYKIIGPSDSEQLYGFNFDFFEIEE